jgi:hypothetical protein
VAFKNIFKLTHFDETCKSRMLPTPFMPAQAGVKKIKVLLDTGFRRYDR